MMPDNRFKFFSLSLIWVWLMLFALVPFALIIAVSFLSHTGDALMQLPATISNYQRLNDSIYYKIFERSFVLASMTTLLCLLFGYPFAYKLARMKSKYKPLLMMLVIIPFWTSSLIRSYALIAILKAKGLLNSFLLAIGLIHQPLPILFTNTAVIIGLVYNLLPFMILPIMTNVERLDTRLVEAAYDLGASKFTTFRKVIIPQTLPGIIAGAILVFLPAMTLFYIPDILGGAKSMLLGNLIENQFLIAENWPSGAAISTVLTLVLGVLIIAYRFSNGKNKKRGLL